MFGSRREAHRVRDSLYAYLIVVAWGFLWAGVDTDRQELIRIGISPGGGNSASSRSSPFCRTCFFGPFSSTRNKNVTART
jgi:hypothetical protein